MPNYDFDLDLPLGKEGEDKLRAALNGKWEVKRDMKVSHTGNVAIEIRDRGRPSGLSQTPAEWWGIWLDGPGYDMEVCVLVKASRLKRLIAGRPTVHGGDEGLAEMVLVPVRQLVEKIGGGPDNKNDRQMCWWD